MISAVSSAPFVYTARATQGFNALDEGTPPGLEVDTVSLEEVSSEELQTQSTPGASEEGGKRTWVKAGLATMAAVAGVTAVAGMATPAHADTSVGVYIGSDGWGVEIRDQDHHHHGHGRRHDHGRHRGPWGGRHRGPWGGGNHRGPWGGRHHDNHGPFYTGVGIDGRVHRFDRFGHVNDGSGHYRMYVDMWGNICYDFNVHH